MIKTKLIVLLFVLFHSWVDLSTGQRHLRARPGPWRQKVQWQSNGHVYSLLSTGAQFQRPVQSRRRSQVYLTTYRPLGIPRRSATSRQSGAEFRSRRFRPSAVGPTLPQPLRQSHTALNADAGPYMMANSLSSDGNQRYLPSFRRDAVSVNPTDPSNNIAQHGTTGGQALAPEYSGNDGGRGQRSYGEEESVPEAAHVQSSRSSLDNSETIANQNADVDTQEAGRNTSLNETTTAVPTSEVGQYVTTEERDTAPQEVLPFVTYNTTEGDAQPANAENVTNNESPNKNHRNSVFHNMYPSGRMRPPAFHPPAPGYGTRYFHNGR